MRTWLPARLTISPVFRSSNDASAVLMPGRPEVPYLLASRQQREKNPEIEWQSTTPGRPDWSPLCKTLAFVLHGTIAGVRRDDDFFVMLNGGNTPAAFIIPAPPAGRLWHRLIDTAAASPRDIVSKPQGGQEVHGTAISVASMAAMVFISKSP